MTPFDRRWALVSASRKDLMREIQQNLDPKIPALASVKSASTEVLTEDSGSSKEQSLEPGNDAWKAMMADVEASLGLDLDLGLGLDIDLSFGLPGYDMDEIQGQNQTLDIQIVEKEVPAPFIEPLSIDLWIAGSETAMESATALLLRRERGVAPSRAPLVVVGGTPAMNFTCDMECLAKPKKVMPSRAELANALIETPLNRVVGVALAPDVFPADRMVVCLPPCAPLVMASLRPWWPGTGKFVVRRIVWFEPFTGRICLREDKEFFVHHAGSTPVHYVMLELSKAPIFASQVDSGDPLLSTLEQFSSVFGSDFKPWMHVCE